MKGKRLKPSIVSSAGRTKSMILSDAIRLTRIISRIMNHFRIGGFFHWGHRFSHRLKLGSVEAAPSAFCIPYRCRLRANSGASREVLWGSRVLFVRFVSKCRQLLMTVDYTPRPRLETPQYWPQPVCSEHYPNRMYGGINIFCAGQATGYAVGQKILGLNVDRWQ